MAEFQLQGPDGTEYEIEAPDQASALAAFKKLTGQPAEEEDPFGVLHGPAVDRGTILPFSKDEQGRTFLDTDAGVLGWPAAMYEGIKSAVTAPTDVVEGRLDPESPEGVKRAMDFTSAALAVNPAVASGSRAIPGVLRNMRKANPKAPSVDQLLESSEAAYEGIRAMGVDYSSDAVKSLADDISRELTEKGILAELAPKTHAVLGKLQTPPDGSVASIEGLIAARRAFGNAAGDFTNPTERLAAQRVIDRLDEFLEKPDQASVVARADLGLQAWKSAPPIERAQQIPALTSIIKSGSELSRSSAGRKMPEVIPLKK
jgi:hypothetical protein